MYLNDYREALPQDVAARVSAAMNDALEALNRGIAVVGGRAAEAFDSVAVADLAAASVQVQSVAQGRDGVVAGTKSLETWGQAAIRAGAALASVARRLRDESTAAAIEGDVAGAVKSMQNATGDGFPWYYIVGGAVALLAAAAMFLSKKPRAVAGYRKRRFREFEPEDQLSGFGGCRRR